MGVCTCLCLRRMVGPGCFNWVISLLVHFSYSVFIEIPLLRNASPNKNYYYFLLPSLCSYKNARLNCSINKHGHRASKFLLLEVLQKANIDSQIHNYKNTVDEVLEAWLQFFQKWCGIFLVPELHFIILNHNNCADPHPILAI